MVLQHPGAAFDRMTDHSISRGVNCPGWSETHPLTGAGQVIIYQHREIEKSVLMRREALVAPSSDFPATRSREIRITT